MTLRRLLLESSLTLLIAAASIGATPDDETARVLFVGNSLTYVGNLPAVLSAVCEASGHHCAVEMVVQGGGTLTERVADRSLERALAKGSFDFVVLQERGGDLIGAQMSVPDSQHAAESAAARLVQAARDHAMKPVLLGTYQGMAEASHSLVVAERSLAAKLDSPYVQVSNYLRCGQRDRPALRWFDADGMHPGPDLTLMMAALLHREMFGGLPPDHEIAVRAPIYQTRSGLNANEFASAQAVRPATPASIVYDAATVKAVDDVARSDCTETS